MRYPKNWKPGNVMKIPLAGGYYSYGVVIKYPLIGFFDYRSKNKLEEINNISSKPILFKVWVMKYALSKNWKIVGNIALNEKLKKAPLFFKKDPINGKFFIYSNDRKDIPAEYDEVKNLECAAGWDPEHIEDRLNDYYEKKPNKWVESLKAKE